MPHPKTPPSSFERQAAEADQAVQMLANFHGVLRSGIFDDESAQDAATFLQALELVVEKLRVETASRRYRDFFAQNYIELFREEPHLYRMDIFRECMGREQGVVVNGEFMPFEENVRERRRSMKEALDVMLHLLGQWQSSDTKPSHERLRRNLAKLDVAWAAFEESYIVDLTRIEMASRTLVMRVAAAERRLRRTEHSDELQLLLEYLGQLNSLANRQRRHRSSAHFNLGIVKLAKKVATGPPEHHDPGFVVATRLSDALAELREYLRGADRNLIRINPVLHENRQLVARLEAFDEKYTLGEKYLEPRTWSYLRESTEQIRTTCQLSRKLTSLIQEQEPELFLVLPRVIWLCYLRHPMKQVPLLRSLVPHLVLSGFAPREPENSDAIISVELQKLGKSFKETVEALHKARVAGTKERTFGWDVLLKRAVEGRCEGATLGALTTPDARGKLQARVERFMVELEKLSMELQRHSAQKWNQYTSVLIQCLSGRPVKKEDAPEPWEP